MMSAAESLLIALELFLLKRENESEVQEILTYLCETDVITPDREKARDQKIDRLLEIGETKIYKILCCK